MIDYLDSKIEHFKQIIKLIIRQTVKIRLYLNC